MRSTSACASVGFLGREPRRPASTGRNRGLDDEGLGGRLERRSGLDEPGGNDRHAGGFELLEVALVGVPLEQRHLVDHPRQRPRPREELFAALGVVPRRAQDDEVERAPVDPAVVPDGRNAIDAVSGESGEEEPVVGLQVRNLGTRRERDARQMLQAPSCCTICPSSSMRPPERRSLTMSQWMLLVFWPPSDV